jgi:hypothetical protein
MLSLLYKYLYTSVTLVTLSLRLLAICLYYVIPAARPHSVKTYRQTIGQTLLSLGVRELTAVRFSPPKSLDPGAEGERFIVINPATAQEKYPNRPTLPSWCRLVPCDSRAQHSASNPHCDPLPRRCLRPRRTASF